MASEPEIADSALTSVPESNPDAYVEGPARLAWKIGVCQPNDRLIDPDFALSAKIRPYVRTLR